MMRKCDWYLDSSGTMGYVAGGCCEYEVECEDLW